MRNQIQFIYLITVILGNVLRTTVKYKNLVYLSVRRREGTKRVRIFRVRRKKGVLRSLKIILGQKPVALGIVLVTAGGTVLVYSFGHGITINSPFVQQSQVQVKGNTASSFLFGQPYNHTVYLNISAPGHYNVSYKLYEMPSHQVAFYSSDYNSHFMEDTKQLQLPSQFLSNKTLFKSGTASGDASIVLNSTRNTLGQEFLLTLQSTNNDTFYAQVSAYTNFQQVETSDWVTGIIGAVVILAGIFVIAFSISKVSKELGNV